ncbi:MAG: hypothetical protein RSC45_12610 [Acinetobacter sp.]
MSDQYDDGFHEGYTTGYDEGYDNGERFKEYEIDELNSQLDEYVLVAECLDDLYVRECKKTKELTEQLDLMKGWEKIAQSNGEDKRKYLAEKDELIDRLKQLLNVCKIQSDFGVYNNLDKGWVDAYSIVVDDIEQLLKDTEND